MCLMLSDTREEGKYSTDLFRFPDLAQRLSDHRTHGASNRHGAYWPQTRRFLFVVMRSYFVPFPFALFSPLFQPDPPAACVVMPLAVLGQPATHSGAEAGRSGRSPWPCATRHRHHLLVARHAVQTWPKHQLHGYGNYWVLLRGDALNLSA